MEKVTTGKQQEVDTMARIEEARRALAAAAADQSPRDLSRWNVSRDADGNLAGDVDVDFSKIDRKKFLGE